MTQSVTVTLAGGIADVRLNRADKHNCLSFEMFDTLNAAAAQVAADASVRVVVLSGNGPSFCAGLDVAILRGIAAGPEQARDLLATQFSRDGRPENRAQRTALAWRAAPVPVIAALHGAAYGGGCQIALGADLRIAAPDTRLSLMEIRYGLIPDMGVTQTLRDLVPLDIAFELTLTGRTVTAEEARSLGLITRLASDPRAEALELARTVAGRSPDAVRAAKRLFREAWRADAATGLALEQTLQETLLGSPNQCEAVRAALEKREPVFTDPQPRR